MFYKYGLTLSEPWGTFTVLVSLPGVVAFCLKIFLIIRAVILNIRFGTIRLLIRIILIVASIGYSFLAPRYTKSSVVAYMEGFREQMKQKADITGIQAWLDTLDVDNLTVSRVSQYGTWIYYDNWPNPIKKLLSENRNPKDYPPKRVLVMKSKNGKTYVRVPYESRAALVVGVGAEEIPLNDCHVSEYRLELAPNAFVGYRLKHAKENVGF